MCWQDCVKDESPRTEKPVFNKSNLSNDTKHLKVSVAYIAQIC